jgi:DNA mismatch endonuclease Vsr
MLFDLSAVFSRQQGAFFLRNHLPTSADSPPSSNKEYWNQKIEKNRIRDRKTKKLLKEAGWFVIRIWEHEIKQKKINHKLNLIKGHIHDHKFTKPA